MKSGYTVRCPICFQESDHDTKREADRRARELDKRIKSTALPGPKSVVMTDEQLLISGAGTEEERRDALVQVKARMIYRTSATHQPAK